MSQTGTGEGLTDNFIIIIRTGYTILDTREMADTGGDGNVGIMKQWMLKYEQLTPGTDSDLQSTKYYCVEFRQQRRTAGLSDNEGLSSLSHLIRNINSGRRASGSLVFQPLWRVTPHYTRGLSHLVSAVNIYCPGRINISFYRVMLWTRGGQVLVLLIKLRSSLAEVSCPCVTQSWKYNGIMTFC